MKKSCFFFSSFLLFFSISQSLLAQVKEANLISQVDISYRAHEIKIEDSKINRQIFIALPWSVVHGTMVDDLLIKNHRYFYCTREPDGIFNCYLYLNKNFDGEFENFEKDHNYGEGSISEYMSNEKLSDRAKIKIDNKFIQLTFDGHIAKKIYNKIDLANYRYGRKGGVDYEMRIGRHIKCLGAENLEGVRSEYFSCKMKIPIRPIQNEEEKIDQSNKISID